MKSPFFGAGVAGRFFALGWCLVSAGIPAGAATLVSYMGTDILANTQTLAADSGSVALHLTASNLTQAVDGTGTNSAFSGMTDAFFGRSDVVANALDTAVSSNDYITFSVTVENGYALNLSSLTFKLGGTTGGSAYTTNTVLRSSVDGYAANIGGSFSQSLGANISTPAYGDKTVDLSGVSFQSVVGTITFRLYMWDNLTSSTTYTRVDSLVLNGGLSAVPEPAGFAAIAGGAGLAWVAMMRRRRR